MRPRKIHHTPNTRPVSALILSEKLQFLCGPQVPITSGCASMFLRDTLPRETTPEVTSPTSVIDRKNGTQRERQRERERDRERERERERERDGDTGSIIFEDT
ncbi:hypothetical protein FHG87_000966 [Trinorchestia longiramus]|nr:hypothetical protein FHG87_000966 [Trinorchestia longiramus]